MARQEQEQRAGYCRQCGERLPLIKRVKREEFCSDEHRERYLNSTQSVALSRLQEMALAPEPEVAIENNDGMPSWGAAVMRGAEPPPAATAVAEDPDPPMAGSIVPAATAPPFRMAPVFEQGDLWLGEAEPVRPEQEWRNLALHFGLAEFSDVGPQSQSSPGEMVEAAEEPTEPTLSLAMPGVAWMLAASIDELGVAEGLLAPAMWPEPVGKGRAVRSAPIEPSLTEPDLTVYLPEFSPSAAATSLSTATLPGAEVVRPDVGTPCNWRAPARSTPVAGWEETPATARLELASGCLVDNEDVALALKEPEPQPEVPMAEIAVDAVQALPVQEAVEPPPVPITVPPEIAEESIDEFLSRLAPIAAAVTPREERGMSEGLETISGGISSEGLGTRFAQPFLHEPAPRAGSAKPRWSPATANMGTAPEVMTEDWDIL